MANQPRPVSTSVAKAATVSAAAPAKVTLAQVIERNIGTLNEAMPRGFDVVRLKRTLLTAAKETPKLLQADPSSFMFAAMKAAVLGLEPGGALGLCYLLPFDNRNAGITEVQFILGYKGMLALARRSGELSEVYADVVFEGDEFDYMLGTERYIHHKRNPNRQADAPVTHAYAVAKFKDGGQAMRVLDIIEIEAHRSRSKAKDNGPWKTDYAAMARKTALRALGSGGELPLTVEAMRAAHTDEDVVTRGDFIDAEDSDFNPDALAAIAAATQGNEVPESATTNPVDNGGRTDANTDG